MSAATHAPFAAKGISVIVPVYNESLGVRQTLTELTLIMRGLGWPFEIVIVDDGSTDISRREIEGVSNAAIRLIIHQSNRGYGASLTNGLLQARFPSVVITDADGTYPLSRIPELVAGLDQYVMVVGARVGPHVHVSRLRLPVKWCLRRLAELLTGQAIPDLNSGLRAMRRDAILPLEPILPQRFSWTSTVTVALLLGHNPVVFLPIAYYQRQGVSKVHPILDTLRAVQCILRAAAFGYTHQRPTLHPDEHQCYKP